MKNNLLKLYILLFAAASFTIIGCGDDDNNGDPCEGVVCADNEVCSSGTCVEINTGGNEVQKSGLISANETWTADKCYVLTSKVVVSSGVTLIIEPGTIIKGRPGAGSFATALIVARGGRIMADGTADKPIIFTSTEDNIEIGQTIGTNLNAENNSLWGGVLVLGSAKISAGDGDTEAHIEGIPASEEYGRYGGDNDADNSGVLRYVSIRHGGAEIGSGNEINGLTLGGVGNGTTIENIEVLGNLDDGIECFGGTVNISNAIVVYQGDDAIDLDQNYAGTISNFVVIMGGGDGDEGLEIDGPEGTTYTNGKFRLENGTIISDGNASHNAADFKSKAQGQVLNCMISGFNDGKWAKFRESFDAENQCADKSDAYDRLVSGDLFLQSCDFVSSSATDASIIARVYTGSDGCENSVTDAMQMVADIKMSETANEVVTSSTEGADMSQFGWSFAATKNLLP